MLVQIDGSFHRWLGDNGPQFTLLLAVDDATSAVVNAVFSPEEDTSGILHPDAGTDRALGLAHRPVQRPPRRVQVLRQAQARQAAGGSHHFSRPWWNWASSRSSPVAASERPCGTGRGTFQDRLGPNCLAGASTIDQACRAQGAITPVWSRRSPLPPVARKASSACAPLGTTRSQWRTLHCCPPSVPARRCRDGRQVADHPLPATLTARFPRPFPTIGHHAWARVANPSCDTWPMEPDVHRREPSQ